MQIKRLVGSAGIQTLVPQLLGMALFFALSKWLSKDAFGLMGWYTATGFVLTVLGSFGLEQVVYRRIAAGNGTGDWAARAYWVHSGLVTVGMLLILGGITWAFPAAKTTWLPLFFAAQATLSLAAPFRLLLNARLQFMPYARATILANAAKLVAAYGLHRSGTLSLPAAGLVMPGGNGLEYTLAWLAFRKTPHQPFRIEAYRLLLKEAAPQYLSVVFDVLLSRIDWILLGLLATTASLADYSFAYRAYEVERLPITLFSSLLLPVVARQQAGKGMLPEHRVQYRSLLVGVPLLMSGLSWILVLLWKPMVGGLLKSDFGDSAYLLVGILNLSLVFQFAINQLWIQAFAARRYLLITRITVFTALLNLGCNLLLIPQLGALGAAWSIVVSTAFQFGYYAVGVRKIGFPVPLRVLLSVSGFHGLLTALLFRYAGSPVLVGSVALVAYPLLLWATGILNKRKLQSLLSLRKAV